MSFSEGINVNTLRCLAMVNELSKLIPNGIKPFSECEARYKHNHIFYYEDDGEYKIVLDSCVDEQHHDVVSNYDAYCDNKCNVRLMDINDKPYISILFPYENNEIIIESDGRWYMV